MSVRRLTATFAGGEMSPFMLSRYDDGLQQQGVRKCLNMVTWPQGSAKRRPGFQHVREAGDGSKRVRLIPFSYGQGQELAIEMGVGYFRFHVDGATLLFIGSIPVASVDTATDRITFAQPHNLVADELIRFLPGDGGVLPTGTGNPGYYTRIVDAYTIEISLTFGGTAVNISTAGTLPVYCYRFAEQPDEYIPSRAFASVSTAADTITTSGAHNLTTGDPIEFTLSGGVLPTYLDGLITRSLLEGVVYYAIVTGASVIQVATTKQNALDGIELNLNGAGSGAPIVHYYYTPGQTVTHSSPDGHFQCVQAGPKLVLPGTTSHWAKLRADGVLEVKHTYAEADLFDVHYAQSGDILTLVHQNYKPSELSRVSFSEWSWQPIAFESPLPAPTITSVVPTAGATHIVDTVDIVPSPAVIVTKSEHGLVVNDPVYVSGSVGDIPEGFYAVRSNTTTHLTLKTLDGGADVDSTVSTPVGGKIRAAIPSNEVINYYRVTAIDETGAETEGSNAGGATNNLFSGGSYNTINWAPVIGAARYRVYKFKTGIYGYIGETEELTFKDDSIGPDLSVTLPRFDSTFSLPSGYPASVGYFEGRRFFGGLAGEPRKVVASRVGYPSDFSYHIPVQDDDRISVQIDAADALTVRHIVPITQLVLLSNSTEFRISPLNTDSITPSSISVRPQTYIGSSMVQPLVINGTLVFAANRGGHLREMGYRADQGFQTGDLSMRATHLFDGKTIVDVAYQKAPVPIIWAVSSDGKLLGMTYTPEEGVGGWHQHTTSNSGVFESVCVVSDGGVEDSVYVVVKRVIDGTTYRMVERMTNVIQPSDASDWKFLDCSLSFDGTVNSAITVTRATTWASGQSVTIAGTNIFRTVTTADVGDYVRVAYNGNYYRLRVTSVASGNSATASILDAIPIATATTSFASSLWGWMRDTISVPAWLEGEKVSVVADGVEQPDETVSGGVITLASPKLKGVIGYDYTSELQLLPFAAQFEAYAQGRTINIKDVTVRYWKSGEFEVGPELSEYDMARIAASTSDEDGIEREHQMPLISKSATLWVRQRNPRPLTVVSITTEATIGS